MNEVEFVKSVQTLKISENDILVVKIDQKLSVDRIKKIKKSVEDYLPIGMKGKVKMSILDEGVDMGIIRMEKEE